MKQVIKQVINGVEKLLLVEVLEEIDINDKRQKIEELENEITNLRKLILEKEKEVQELNDLIDGDILRLGNIELPQTVITGNGTFEQEQLTLNEGTEEAVITVNETPIEPEPQEIDNPSFFARPRRRF